MDFYERTELVESANETLDLINGIIRDVKIKANEMDIPPVSLRNPDGSWVLVPLLVTKTQLLDLLLRLKLQ